jgi:ketosteroid isomerase-like protein
MSDPLSTARRLYDAFAAHDGPALLDVLAEDFVGDVSEGMPLGVGGLHAGRDAMLREVWGPVFAAYEIRVELDALHASGSDHVIALGHYRGTDRSDGVPVDARFAHVLTIDGEQITALRQITDTNRWRIEG